MQISTMLNLRRAIYAAVASRAEGHTSEVVGRGRPEKVIRIERCEGEKLGRNRDLTNQLKTPIGAKSFQTSSYGASQFSREETGTIEGASTR